MAPCHLYIYINLHHGTRAATTVLHDIADDLSARSIFSSTYVMVLGKQLPCVVASPTTSRRSIFYVDLRHGAGAATSMRHDIADDFSALDLLCRPMSWCWGSNFHAPCWGDGPR
jgi:hypothetical protein